jgi:hypothetical protein
MTDKKISELSSNGTLGGTELIPLVQSGSNVKALLSAVKTFIIDGLLSAETAATTYLSIANSKYQPLEKTGTTYILESSDVTANSKIILELSNNSFTDFTLPTPTSLNITVGMGFNVVITGTYGGQTLVAGSGATLLGSPAFTDTNHCKTVVAWSATAWRIFG